jgi:hypothetical protein
MWALTQRARTLDNNKMQQTRHGQNGASLLILVLDGRRPNRRGVA